MKKQGELNMLGGLALFITGVILISIGIDNNENIVVLQKAIRICMECIGIG